MISGWWGAALVLGVAFAWSVFVGARYDYDDRLARWWVRRARRWGRSAGPRSLLVSAGVLLAYVLLVAVSQELGAQLGDERWGLLVHVPALLAYVPFMLATAPMQFSAYTYWRADLEQAGADKQLGRRIAWWAGVPSFVGLFAVLLAVAGVFVL